MQGQTSPRYHALDSLRAVMMLLGIYLHVACAYGTLKDTWWYQDSRQSPVFDYILMAVHLFRMPVFYVMAGFFAALLYTRRGTVAFLKNRASRILAPFFLAMLAFFPILTGMQRISRGWTYARTWDWLIAGQFLKWLHPMHLWFLWYLALLYVIAIVVLVRSRRAGFSWVEYWFRRAVRAEWAPAIFAVPAFGCLLLMQYGLLDTPHEFVPQWHLLFTYAYFFGFGWALYLSADLLARFGRHAWRNTLIAAVLTACNLVFLMRQVAVMPKRDWIGFAGAAATGALAAWFVIFGVTGLFLRYLDRPIPAMRYLSDSAYWMFLFHPVPVLALNIVFSSLAWSPFVKMGVILAITSVIVLATYHYGVRSTWIGVLLNGRRYERKTPSNSPEPRTASKPERKPFAMDSLY